jgi:diacylglycerol kinase (ATP)
VYQLPKQKPDKVLKKIWENLSAAIKQGDEKAHHIQNNMRVVAAGGDGTFSWLLQAVG